jgi:hypothetical protein
VVVPVVLVGPSGRGPQVFWGETAGMDQRSMDIAAQDKQRLMKILFIPIPAISLDTLVSIAESQTLNFEIRLSGLANKLINKSGTEELSINISLVKIQVLYTVLTLAFIPILYHSYVCHGLYLIVIVFSCIHNGAGYYFEVFSKKVGVPENLFYAQRNCVPSETIVWTFECMTVSQS